MKSSALRKLGGTLLGTWLAVNPGSALAQDMMAKATPASHPPQSERTIPAPPQQQVEVPMIDARTNSVGAVNFAAVAQSDDSIIVVFYGKDRNLFNDAKEATREAIAEGLPVRGMVFGPPIDESYVEVYANNLLISAPNIKWDKEGIREVIIYANEKYVRPDQVAAVPSVTR